MTRFSFPRRTRSSSRMEISSFWTRSISVSGGPELALWGFMAFYVTCVAITWHFYTRRGGLLHDIERGGSLPPATMQPAE